MTDDELGRIIEKLHEHHESVSRNASRLNILTNNLLDVARFESDSNGDIILQKEKVDLVKEIDDIIENQFIQLLTDKNLLLNSEYDNVPHYVISPKGIEYIKRYESLKLLFA